MDHKHTSVKARQPLNLFSINRLFIIITWLIIQAVLIQHVALGQSVSSTQSQPVTQQADTIVMQPCKILRYSFDGPSLLLNNKMVIGKQTHIRLHHDGDSLSKVKMVYRIDNQSTQLYSTPFAIMNAGDHVVAFKRAEHAGDTSMNTFYVLVDTLGPAIQIIAQYKSVILKIISTDRIEKEASKLIFPLGTELYFKFDDPGSGVDVTYMKIDGAPEQPGINHWKFTAKGTHSIVLRATDLVSNETITQPVTFSITN